MQDALRYVFLLLLSFTEHGLIESGDGYVAQSEKASDVQLFPSPNSGATNPRWISTSWIASTILGDSVSNEPIEVPLPKFKPHALQRIAFAGGTMVATRSNDLSSSFAETSITLGMPLGSMDNPLAITPGVRVDWMDAPVSFGVPRDLYDIGLEFFYQRTLNDRWKFLGIVRPSIRSDFEAGRTPVRTFGLALFLWDYLPERLTLSMGSVYLGRSDLPPLPAAGLIWTPNSRRRLELQFPRSRWLARIAKVDGVSETWLNNTIGIGGNPWMVRNALNQSEEMSLRDIRWTVEVQKTRSGGGGWFAETGLAMDRRLEFLTTDDAVSLSNAAVFSAGWSY